MKYVDMRNFEKEQRLGRNGIENLCIKSTFNYCTGEEQFTFFKLSKCLIDDACFLGLSIDAKLLYAIFLDRVAGVLALGFAVFGISKFLKNRKEEN